MGQNHLIRIAAPKSWKIKRKQGNKYIARPIPGPHPIQGAITINFLLRHLLEYAKTTKEIKKIISEKQILIDGLVRNEHKYPIGLMDVISIPKLEENYRLIYNRSGTFLLLPVKKDEVNVKLLKLVRKTIVKKGKIQLTFHDGRNILVDKFDGSVGDSILFNLSKKHVDKILNLDKESLVYLSGGSHVGIIAKVKDVIKAKDLQKPKVLVEIEGKDYITLMEYAFVVGKNKPEINLEVKQ